MRAFVGVDRFQVHHVAHHAVFVRDAVAAVHVAGVARDLERLADVVALDDRDHLRREPPFVHQPPDPERRLQPESDLRLHIGELFLEKLGGGQWAAELLAIQPILARGVEAELGRPHRSPADPVTRAVQTTERPFQPLDMGQDRILADLHVFHDDHAGDRRAQ